MLTVKTPIADFYTLISTELSSHEAEKQRGIVGQGSTSVEG